MGCALESAPFVLLGFFMAGLLKAFLPDDLVASHLGGRGIGSIFKAARLAYRYHCAVAA